MLPKPRDPALLAKLKEKQRQAQGVRQSKYAQQAAGHKKYKNTDIDSSVDQASQLMRTMGHTVDSKKKKQLEHIIRMATEYGPEAALQKMGVKDMSIIEKIMKGMDEFSKIVQPAEDATDATDAKADHDAEDVANIDEEIKESTEVNAVDTEAAAIDKETVSQRKPIQPPQNRNKEDHVAVDVFPYIKESIEVNTIDTSDAAIDKETVSQRKPIQPPQKRNKEDSW